MSVATVVAAGLLGVPAGWFAGLLIDRIPDREPLFEDIPGIRLHGKYLAVMVLMVALFVGTAIRVGDYAGILEVAAYLLLVGMLLTVSVIDIELFRLPDRIVLPTLAASIVLVVVASIVDGDATRIRYALAGAGLYFGFLLLAHLIYPKGMGFGDVKLAAVMGLYVGWIGETYTQSIALVLWAMMIGFIAGSAIGIVALVMRKKSAPIPFGPFLALGTVAVVLLGRGLVVA